MTGCRGCEETTPLPEPESVPWGNSMPVAQTTDHAFVITGDAFYVVDLVPHHSDLDRLIAALVRDLAPCRT